MSPIVFVPGLLCSAEIFAPQIAALWPYGPVMIASTLEGETMSEIATAILADAPQRFALVGISMGGYICFEIMRQAPERVLKLALLDTSARPDTPEETERRLSYVTQAREGDFRALLEQIMPVTLLPAHRADPLLRDVNIRMGLTVGLEGFARQAEAAGKRIDSRPMLSKISVPTLVLVGESDTVIPPDRSGEIAGAISNARLVVVAECGHGSPIEQPEAVNRALIEWITG